MNAVWCVVSFVILNNKSTDKIGQRENIQAVYSDMNYLIKVSNFHMTKKKYFK